MKKSFITVVLIIILLITGFMSCSEVNPSANTELEKQTERIMDEIVRELGLPDIVNFTEKKNLKWIYELCDQQGLICHAYFYNSFKGAIGDYIGPVAGYGIPYSAQYSNPEKIIKFSTSVYYSGQQPSTMPQPEPNGIFKPEGLSATWLIVFHPETKKPMPAYIEPEIVVFPYKLK